MASSLQKKKDPDLRLVSDEDAVVIPENARATDESPTVISKTQPLVEAVAGSSREKIVDLSRKHANPEAIVASLRGKRLAHYALIEPIGVGGMAAVIRARDTQLERFVALKILPPEMAHETENVQRFHQEAKAAAKLDHENIARVFYCGEDQGLHFIAFEFVEGMNLRVMLDQRGRLPVAEAVRYILQIAAGLEHAATRGVVHRDVKPSNIIVTPTGRAKLVDMGLARNLERKGEIDLTQSGVTLGTFDYISPEQALEPRDADMRSDIYSLGCTFYHLLTGQPPVPEGTPAKKLQHHQNSAPIDPRSIDPAIPDEIVMILGKMMAKSPKERYQRPIHLVHHLMQVAQKVGAADDMPEGMLLVDAPLPNQPRSRPLLYIGLALAALIVVTVLASLVSDPGRNPGSRLVGDANKGGGDPFKKDGQIAPKTNFSVNPDTPAVVKKSSELEAVLSSQGGREIKAKLRGKIELDRTGLAFNGTPDQQLVLESDNANNYATLHHRFVNESAPFGLVLDGGQIVVFKRCKFLIESAATPDAAAATVAIRGGAHHVKFEQCIFAQENEQSLSPDGTPLASVLIDTSEAAANVRPIVTFDRCYFEGTKNYGGQVAVAVNGPATINVVNCAFRPHGAFFHFREMCTAARTSLDVRQSAGLVVLGPAFRFDANASALVQAGRSVFSRPDSSLGPNNGLPEPNLVFLAEKASIQYEGDANVYHNLNAMVGRRTGGLIAKADDFQKFLKDNRGADANSRYLDSADTPWQDLNRIDERAFQLKWEYHNRVGLTNTWRGAMEVPPEALVKNVPPMPRLKQLIVDAEAEAGTPGVFTTLNGALSEAKDGDVILIRHGESRDVVVPPIELKPGVHVMLKPDKDCQPRLVLNRDYRDKETNVFKIRGGKVEMEGLEIVLDPGQDADVLQSIVQLGDAHCIFRGCVFTLRAANREQLSLVSSIDADRMMKSENPPPMTARIEFHECFVRGKGDLVSLNGCRLLKVDLKNSLVALDGSLLDVEAGAKSMPMTQGVRWDIERSSLFTTDAIFALRSRLGKVLTETHADVRGSLLD